MNRDAFAAIADPTRREIIGLLSKESLNINQVSDHFENVSRQAVTKQLKYLSESGLIEIHKEGREKLCILTLDSLNEVNQWLRKYERFWNKKFDNLKDYLDNSDNQQKTP